MPGLLQRVRSRFTLNHNVKGYDVPGGRQATCTCGWSGPVRAMSDDIVSVISADIWTHGKQFG